MKSLRITIFNLVVTSLLLAPLESTAQRISVEVGIYDYTDDVAREFYLLSPMIVAGYDYLIVNKLRFNVAAGLGYRQFNYHENKHYLYTIPIFVSIFLDINNGESKLYPSAGMGLSGMYKADRTERLSSSHQSFTYGYHMSGILNYRLNNCKLFIEIRYNHLLPPAMDEIRLSGFMLMVGIRF